jgi:hypothetical protein
VGGFAESQKANSASPKEKLSESMCPASTKSASDPVMRPPITSATVYVKSDGQSCGRHQRRLPAGVAAKVARLARTERSNSEGARPRIPRVPVGSQHGLLEDGSAVQVAHRRPGAG